MESAKATIIFVVPPGVHLLDINGPAHIFFEAYEKGASIDLRFVSSTQQPEVRSSAGLFFAKLEDFQSIQLGATDYVFIPGVDFPLLEDTGYLARHQPFFNWVREQHAAQATICSVCTGSFLLAETGLLNGFRCTTHWKYFESFHRRYPRIELLGNRLFVQENRLFSSAGVASGIDLALYLLETLYGTRFAVEIAKEVVLYFRRSESDPQLSVFLQYRNHLDQRVHAAQDYISQHLADGLSVTNIALAVNTSSRNLSRLFKRATGITVGYYIERLRAERAAQLLGAGAKLTAVVAECGLKSTNQMRTILKRHVGQLPSGLK